MSQTQSVPRQNPEQVRQIIAHARELGFDLVGITSAAPPASYAHYLAWLERGFEGGMAYLRRPDAVERRRDPGLILSGVQTIIVVGANYHTQPLAARLRDDPSLGIVSNYAWAGDYHDLLLPRLDQLALHVGGAHRSYVDTGPILERDLAARAGLGFVGKNTNLIHPRLGSWLFLGVLLLTNSLPSAQAEPGARQGTCGNCSRCIDACPTGALVEPYLLDAGRCISTLTIEHKGPIPSELRPLIGNRIFGCDICQEVCPWNLRFARPAEEPAFQAPNGTAALPLLDLMALDQEGFRQRFKGSPIQRAKRRGLLRNAAVALGNWGDPRAVPVLARALKDTESLVRGHAAWALGRIAGSGAQEALIQAMRSEIEPWVREEIAASLR